jgi:hypothetical protein
MSDSDILSTEEYVLPLRPGYPAKPNGFSFLDSYPVYLPAKYMSGLNFQLIEEEIRNISMNRSKQSNMDSLMSSFNHVKLGQNGQHIQEEHISFLGANNAAQRRPSFKRHPTVPFGLSQGSTLPWYLGGL